MKLYDADGKFVIVTDECPKGMEGVLFVGKEGSDPDNLKEVVVSKGHVDKWTEVEPDNKWRAAMGLPALSEPVEVAEVVEDKPPVIHYRETVRCDKVSEIVRLATVIVISSATIACMLISPAATAVFLLVLLITCKERLMRYVG